MNAPIKPPKIHYFLIRCEDGDVMYEYGMSTEDVSNMMSKHYPWKTVESIELIK